MSLGSFYLLFCFPIFGLSVAGFVCSIVALCRTRKN